MSIVTKTYLLISRPHGGFAPLHVTCAFSGDPDGLRVVDRGFSRPSDLEKALQAAGVAEHEMRATVKVFNTGMPTFISVSKEVARKLGVLEQVHSSIVPESPRLS